MTHTPFQTLPQCFKWVLIYLVRYFSDNLLYLQGVEEYLENHLESAAAARGRLAFPQDPIQTSDPFTPIINRSTSQFAAPIGMHSNTKGDSTRYVTNMSMLQNDSIAGDLNVTGTSRRSLINTEQKKLKSVYMDNQLDLNEKELDYYEGVIDTILGDIEKANEEKV